MISGATLPGNSNSKFGPDFCHSLSARLPSYPLMYCDAFALPVGCDKDCGPGSGVTDYRAKYLEMLP